MWLNVKRRTAEKKRTKYIKSALVLFFCEINKFNLIFVLILFWNQLITLTDRVKKIAPKGHTHTHTPHRQRHSCKINSVCLPYSADSITILGSYGKFNEKNRLTSLSSRSSMTWSLHGLVPVDITQYRTATEWWTALFVGCCSSPSSPLTPIPTSRIPADARFNSSCIFINVDADADALRFYFSMKIQHLIETVSHIRSVFILKIAFDYIRFYLIFIFLSALLAFPSNNMFGTEWIYGQLSRNFHFNNFINSQSSW